MSLDRLLRKKQLAKQSLTDKYQSPIKDRDDEASNALLPAITLDHQKIRGKYKAEHWRVSNQ